jgi:hypothetical protein
MMCRGVGCPHAEACLRFISKANPDEQMWFTASPCGKNITGDKNKCAYFVPIENIKNQR